MKKLLAAFLAGTIAGQAAQIVIDATQGAGVPLYVGFGQVNSNFTELYNWKTNAPKASATIIVDATNGSNSTGTRGRTDLPFATIPAAIAVLQAGDTILLRPGTHTLTSPGPQVAGDQFAHRTNSAALVDSVNNWSLRGDPGATIYSSAAGNVLALANCTNVVIDGVTFRGPGSNLGGGAWTYIHGLLTLWGTCNEIRVLNCRFYDYSDHALLCSQTDKSSKRITVAHCTFTNGGERNHTTQDVDGAGIASLGSQVAIVANHFENVARGIELESSSSSQQLAAWIIDGNTLTNIWNMGVMIFPTSGNAALITDVAIVNNHIATTTPRLADVPVANGIGITGGQRLTIANNTVTKAGDSGIALTTQHAALANVIIDGNQITDCGVPLSFADTNGRGSTGNARIANNLIHTFYNGWGIRVSASYVDIAGNWIGNGLTGSDGIQLLRSHASGTTAGNVVRHNFIASMADDGIDIAANSTGTVVEGNYTTAITGSALVDAGTSTVLRFPVSGDNSMTGGFDATNLVSGTIPVGQLPAAVVVTTEIDSADEINDGLTGAKFLKDSGTAQTASGDVTWTGLSTFTGPVKSTINTLSGSTVYCAQGNTWYVLLDGNKTLSFDSLADNQAIRLIAQQDGTGGRTLTIPSAIDLNETNQPAATSVPIATGALAFSVVDVFRRSGTNTFTVSTADSRNLRELASATRTTGTVLYFDGSNLAASTRVLSGLGSSGTLTLPSGTDTLVARATTDTLTGKTFDASGTGNVLKQTKYLLLLRPDYGDGAGAVPQTNSYTASGLMHYTFSGSAETNANYVVYETVVPPDIDTSVELTATLGFLSGGTDADAVTFHLTYGLATTGADYPPTVASLPIAMNITPTTPDTTHLQVSAATTLTGWSAAMTAGSPLLIKVARKNNDNDDSARDVFLRIAYASTL